MIAAFGDFNEAQNQFDYINLNSWTKLVLKSEYVDINTIYVCFKIREVAWMWARFPCLQHLEFYSNLLFNPTILSIFLFERQIKFNSYLKQIKILSSKLNINKEYF